MINIMVNYEMKCMLCLLKNLLIVLVMMNIIGYSRVLVVKLSELVWLNRF